VNLVVDVKSSKCWHLPEGICRSRRVAS
jgi:hypothetical protein